ncbi:3-oxoacid CoA-transferase [Wallemia mellicola]|uniref:Succinyl-CoA:3-ketoacid-coenzyme A transferase n=1 Tax=Wallemia mellicola TaxID=1708541 RepID=A0A4T0S6N6_9BASI|nr:3-oxoacid CoA-transferase [Wallemia mellicola]TIC46440.1 3-oxoacid CoA-transferase [Wallemia mellicola]
MFISAVSTRRTLFGCRFYVTKVRGGNKIYDNANDAIKDIRSSAVYLSGGFGLCGVPTTLLNAIDKRNDIKSITAVSNNPGVGDKGLAKLLNKEGKVERLICSYLGNNKTLEGYYRSGRIAVELTPQGNIAERVSAAARGIPAFYTPTGYGTAIESGELVTQYDANSKPIAYQQKREVRMFNGRGHILETSLKADYALIRAKYADKNGNLVFNNSAHNFNAVFAKAADITIVEAENIVNVGDIPPNEIHVPGIYVDRICPTETETDIEILKASDSDELTGGIRDKIAKRAARELQDGYYCNLGVGIPGRVPEFIEKSKKVYIQSENGILGVGSYPQSNNVDPDIINASKETVTLLPGASSFGSEESFGMIRSGKIDVSLLGAFQVSQTGDLANFMIPGKLMKGMGGAMDLVSNPQSTKVIILMEHCDKYGKSKILKTCDLPLTGKECVSQIITDLAVFQINKQTGRLLLTDIAEGVTLDHIKLNTEAEFDINENIGSF